MNKVLEERDRQRDRQRDRENKCEIAKEMWLRKMPVADIIGILKITEEELQQMLKEGE